MGRVEYHALLLILLFLNASMVGCFANDDDSDFANGDALNIAPDPLTAGIFQSVYFKADEAMRVLIPYLVLQPNTGYIQNGTVLDLGEDEEYEIVILISPTPSTPPAILSPLLIGPTPSGVPVYIRSPGLSVIVLDRIEIISGTDHINFSIFESCLIISFTDNHILASLAVSYTHLTLPTKA